MTHPEITVSRADHSASEEVAGAFVEKLAFDALWLEKEQWRMACERTEFALKLSMDITECQDALSAYVGIVYNVAMIALAEQNTALQSQLGQAHEALLLAQAELVAARPLAEEARRFRTADCDCLQCQRIGALLAAYDATKAGAA